MFTPLTSLFGYGHPVTAAAVVTLRNARLVKRGKTLIWERREAAIPPMAEAVGFLAAIL